MLPGLAAEYGEAVGYNAPWVTNLESRLDVALTNSAFLQYLDIDDADSLGSPYYTLTTPVFSKVTLHLDPKYYPNGDITITTDRTSPSQFYMGSMTLGGKRLNGYRVSHKQLVEGKQLHIKLRK